MDLLGKLLARKNFRARIIEVEVYDGTRDKGSHAWRGMTERNKIMFGEAGHWYVYLTYGTHWMLNIVTREKKYPAAILIRSVEAVSGPGRLTKQFGITGKLNGKKAAKNTGLWFEDDGTRVPKNKIKKAPRVGIAYAGKYWAGRNWRYFTDFFKKRTLFEKTSEFCFNNSNKSHQKIIIKNK